MRIAFITSHIDKSTQWLWFAQEFKKRNIYQVHIMIDEKQPILYSDLKDNDIKTYYLKHNNIFSHILNFFRVVRILLKHKINIVHTELPYGNLLGLPAAFIAGIKRRINTCENASWAIDYNSKKQWFIDKLAYTLAKKVIVLTDLSKEYLIKHYGLNRENITTIGHSIKVADYENIAPQRIENLRNELGIKPNDIVLGMVARLEDWKGHSYVVEALKDLVLIYPNTKLLIFGSAGDYLAVLNDLIKKNNLQQYIFYKGFVKDNIALYKVFNIHIHVPINEIVETFGISIIEGMISEVPQILTKSGISCDTVKHMENCVEVPYKNSEAIKEAIIMLIENKELGSKLAAQAKKDAIDMFSYEAKVEKHMAVYSSIS